MPSYGEPPELVLEPAVRVFTRTASPVGPSVLVGRRAVERRESGEIAAPETDEEWVTAPGGPTGQVPVRTVRPRGSTAVLPVVLYVHGPTWVFGSADTHDRLVRELAVGADAAVVLPEYTRPPEARHPARHRADPHRPGGRRTDTGRAGSAATG